MVVFSAPRAGSNCWLVFELGHGNRQEALDIGRIRRELLLIGRSVDRMRSLDVGGRVVRICHVDSVYLYFLRVLLCVRCILTCVDLAYRSNENAVEDAAKVVESIYW